MPIVEAIASVGKALLEKAIVEGGRALADKAGLNYEWLIGELTHLGEATYKEMTEIARNIRKEMNDAIERKVDSELSDARVESEFPWLESGEGATLRMIELTDAESAAKSAERHPAKMAKDVAERLAGDPERFSQEAWERADADERLAMLQDAFRVICEEACIPPELAATAELTDGNLLFTEDGVVVANTNIFLRTDMNGELYAAEPIRVTFNRNLLEMSEFNYYSAVSTLYHEMIHVMQQVSVVEGGAFTYSEMVKEWEQDIRKTLSPDGINQLDELYTEYLSEPMETYAHMQQAYFELMLQGVESEYAASAA